MAKISRPLVCTSVGNFAARLRNASTSRADEVLAGSFSLVMGRPFPLCQCSRAQIQALTGTQQRGIAAGRGRIDRERPFKRKPMEIMRSAGLRTRSGQAFAAEGLHTDYGADLVAIHINISDLNMRANVRGGFLDPAVYPKRQTVARRIYAIAHVVVLVPRIS